MDFSVVATIREVKRVPAGSRSEEDSNGQMIVIEGQTENLCLGELVAFQPYRPILSRSSRNR